MKLLYVTSLSGKRLNSFMRSAIVAAKNLNFEFTMACNADMADKSGYEEDCREYGIKLEHIDFARNPLGLKNRKAKRQLLKLMREGQFDIVHCNTPIGGFLGRICAHKAGIKHVIYQAHGFHFWKGAPLKNWLFYYPVEWLLSAYTDVLVTIAKEDYETAKGLKAKNVSYIHGVGIDLNRYRRRDINDRNQDLRKELGIPNNAIVLLSVGELNKNKNHGIVIRALKKLDNRNIWYVICGAGSLKDKYTKLSSESGLSDRVIFAGFCSNVSEYYRMADLFVFPSLREGIPASIMEAMAIGVPVIASDIRGIRDIIPNEKYRFIPSDVHDLKETIKFSLKAYSEEDIENNISNLKEYKFDSVVSELRQLYLSCLEHRG
ncbi:MAG: glycosyltransferase [Lachnospiraceae bacterium]|nr:glycosyltransferase [Lachnospiraceae bacterium]